MVGDQGQAAIDGEAFQAAVDDHPVVGDPAHHRRQYEQAMLKLMHRVAIGVQDSAIVSVHEDIGAGLNLGIDAAGSLETEGAGAGATDNRRRQAGGGQIVDGRACRRDGVVNRRLAFGKAANVLGRAMIGLQTVKT